MRVVPQQSSRGEPRDAVETEAERGAEQMGDVASGLMQLSSAALAADSASSSGRSHRVTTADAGLPEGWHRIVHGSGLPCYVHEGLGVVCWTRPYPLDMGGNGGNALSTSEFHRLVKQHVPPLSIFAPPEVGGSTRRHATSGDDNAVAASAASVAAALSPPLRPPPDSSSTQTQPKKRKLDTALKERVVHIQEKGAGQQSMTLDQFKTLSIGDPRVLQACMELSIKTPAQVLQEYQNRNRGVSINYNTVPVEGDGVKLFKTIVTAGSTVAEGIASTKKIAKQLGAQQLLAMLHQRTARKYHEVADMYNNSMKGQPVITESSSTGPPVPLRGEGAGSAGAGGRVVDPRLQRGSTRQRRARRASPNRDYDASGSYGNYVVDRRGNSQLHWSGYNQQQSGSWPPQTESVVENPGSERVVVYSSSQGTASGGYGGGQSYSNSNSGSGSGRVWSGYGGSRPMPPPNFPSGYPHEYAMSYGDNRAPPATRAYGDYESYRPNPPSSSTSIERVTANLRNQMAKQ